MEYFLATGNLKSQSGLDLMQAKGYAIIADKINNMRFLAHFRAIHRGAYFAEIKTTTVRKLLPENWGYICPVHTPDGHPCGLLNHISLSCLPLTKPSYDYEKHCDINNLCVSLGMNPIQNGLIMNFPIYYYPVILDGKLLGYISPEYVNDFVKSLRFLKVKQEQFKIPEVMEIGFIPKNNLSKNPQFPGVFLYTNEARLVRPVKNIKNGMIEWISPFEQVILF